MKVTSRTKEQQANRNGWWKSAISPVSDTDFYGAEPLRISQEQLDAREKRENQPPAQEKAGRPPANRTKRT